MKTGMVRKPANDDAAQLESMMTQRGAKGHELAPGSVRTGAALQLAIDQSPRIAAQRDAIDALFIHRASSDAPTAGSAVQRKVVLPDQSMQYLRPNILRDFGLHAPANYTALFGRLDQADKTFTLTYGSPGRFVPENSTIQVPRPILGEVAKFGTLDASQQEKLSITVSHMAHEMQHAADYVLDGKNHWTGPDVAQGVKYLAVMETELRAWASEAIALISMGRAGNLVDGWKTFDDFSLANSDEDLIANDVWARIIGYGTKNGHLKQDQDESKICWRKSFANLPDILAWAKDWALKVKAHQEVAVSRAPAEELLVDTEEVYRSPALKSFREGGFRVWKVRRDDDYRYYNFDSKQYKVRKTLATDELADALGSWG